MFLNLGGCRVSRRCINQISRRQPKACTGRSVGTPELTPQPKFRGAREAGESRVARSDLERICTFERRSK